MRIYCIINNNLCQTKTTIIFFSHTDGSVSRQFYDNITWRESILPDLDLLPVEAPAKVGYLALREVIVGSEEEGTEF